MLQKPPSKKAGPLANAAPLFAACVVLAGSAQLATAQMVRGRVVDATTEEGVETAEVRLVGQAADGEVYSGLTNEVGLFAIPVDVPGPYEISVHHIGYDSASTRVILVNDKLTYLDLLVERAAVELPGLNVTVRAQVPFLVARGFYDRAAARVGTFLGPEDVKKLPAYSTPDLMRRLPGLRLLGNGNVRTRGSGFRPCNMRLLVDGVLISGTLRDVPLQAVEAVEIYRGPASTPLEWRDGRGCGAIVIWTKH